MKKKILLVVNPTSKNGKIKKYITKIIRNLEKNNYEVDVKYTKKDKNAYLTLEEYKEKIDVILSCGGDGTINEIVNYLTLNNKKTPLAFIPLGTTNDFGHTLNVPKNITQLSKNISNYEEIKCDTGIINDKKCFNYVLAFGLFTKCSYSTSQKLKKYLGKFAYFLNGIKEVFELKSYKAKITVNNEVYEDEYIYGSISNSVYIGGFKIFDKKDVKLDDGKFEVQFVKKPKNFLELVKIFLDFVSGKENNKIIKIKASEIKIEMKQEINWSIDGEPLEKCNTLNIKNIKQNIKYIVVRDGVF